MLFACVAIPWAIALARVWPTPASGAHVVADDARLTVWPAACSSKHWHLLLPWTIRVDLADGSMAVSKDGAVWWRGDDQLTMNVNERWELLAALAEPCVEYGDRSEPDVTAIALDRNLIRLWGYDDETRARLLAVFDKVAHRFDSHRAPVSVLDCALRPPRPPHAPRVVALRDECSD